ncbi:EamA family transporter [Nocardioides sp. YIM 152315]|uniref:EamA family transporter n=1 Tax=Nocardioides sp. YIM 152315 TaxID=3031760 RepID=UPI0023DA6A0D|nr:EamA family transporter [Nocardioides sp. YIM 152315]MDF1605146.1 EamA family transporter [Nocardioides sp. YIM 152315]
METTALAPGSSVRRGGTLGLAALAPIAWGSGYYVTETFLPPDRPLFGATVRALPFGLLLLAFRPRLPSGAWWWRSLLLGTLNIGAFFALIFVAAYRLPGGTAATLTATAPLVVMLVAWGLVGERPRAASLLGGAVGAVGVALLVLRADFAVDPIGVAASFGAVALSSVGFVLVKRWEPPVDLLTFTAWQLVAGGLVLLPVALLVEGTPPALDLPAVGGFLYLGLAGTVMAYVVWFRGLRLLPAAAVSLVGLLNPVAGTVIGVALAGEAFGGAQALGLLLVLTGILAGQPAVVDRLRRRTPVSAGDGDPDLGRLEVGVGVDDAEAVHAGQAGLHRDLELLAGHRARGREVHPGAVLEALHGEDRAFTARVDAGEQELLHRRHLRHRRREADLPLRLLALRRLVGRGLAR